jgi:hypothetical protein
MTTSLFRALRSLSSEYREDKLLVYMRDYAADDEFISFLSSLNEVDFIVLKNESLKNLCDEMDPYRVFILEKDDLIPLEHPAALLSRS